MTKAKLNKNAQKWVKALRSGKYKQAAHSLATYDDSGKTIGHCCLGVACELALKAKAIEWYDGNQGGLPHDVREWLGLSGPMGDFDTPVREKGHGRIVATDLTDLNDGLRCSFKQIARFIESKPKGLFVD